jgi:pyruvate/2-oxoglutarate/acetoin dehydrogenase E1 component
MSTESILTSYSDAICDGYRYILGTNPKSFVIGQGLWSPWYVGNTMKDLDIEFGKDRVIDTPVSELGTTGAAIGASLNGYSAPTDGLHDFSS